MPKSGCGSNIVFIVADKATCQCWYLMDSTEGFGTRLQKRHRNFWSGMGYECFRCSDPTKNRSGDKTFRGEVYGYHVVSPEDFRP